MATQPYIVLEKAVGQTPLEVLEQWRATQPALANVPLAYAGRLDPMASGKLLVLIGEECKSQTNYHHLDKAYDVEILCGVQSDSGDVLGVISEHPCPTLSKDNVVEVLNTFIGEVTFPYPIFSAKTVQGKPLHTWTMEDRLEEITIPKKKSTIYSLTLADMRTESRASVAAAALQKIETIPPVTDERKALGNDFRRPLVRAGWQQFTNTGNAEDQFYIARIHCICSSGTYMRTLAELVAKKLQTEGLAFSIHRTEIGTYDAAQQSWSHRF